MSIEIGTPLTSTATRVMLLGSGELGKELALSAQRFGLEVIAVDRYERAPAQQVAHRHYVIDMTDPEQILDLVKRERPHYAVPEIEAIATEALLEIESAGLSRVVPSARAVEITMDREKIRRLAAEALGLKTSRYAFAGSFKALRTAAQKVGFPCFVKPTMSSSGKGQSLVEREAELETAWERARREARGRGERVIVEEKIDFDFEITLLTVRTKRGTSFCEPIGHRQEAGDYVESWQPQPMDPEALAQAKEMAWKVTEALGGWGIFGVELFVKEKQVWFSEVSPRPHDTGLVTLITQHQSEFDLHLRAFLGLPVDTKLLFSGASAVIRGDHRRTGPRFSGLEQALALGDLRLFGKPIAYPKRRLGVVFATGDTIEEARQKCQQMATAVALS